MISTSISYRMIANNLAVSLQRVAKDGQVKREADYYNANIGKVKTPADLMKDYRLYAYAMKAAGLEDMTYAKAFMQKVLESDLSDSNSFANKLTDSRYRKFAASFNFGGGTKVAQTQAQEDATIGLYNQSLANADTAAAQDTAYFKIVSEKVKTVEDFLGDPRLRTYALQSLKLDPNTNYAHLKALLTSDLADPDSYANSLPTSFDTGTKDSKGNAIYQDIPKQTYIDFAKSFNFKPDGTLPEGVAMQTAAQQKTMTENFTLKSSDHVTVQAELLNIDYIKAKMDKVTKVSDITGDSRLFGLIKIALRLPVEFMASTFENIVNSDLADPANYAKTQGAERYVNITKLFNFNAESNVSEGMKAQSDTQLADLISQYTANYDADAVARRASDENAFKIKIGAVTKVNDIVNDPQVLKYVLKAYGLDPSTESAFKIKRVLMSDTSQRGNYASSLLDPRYVQLANAFNFDANGDIEAPALAQDESQILQMSRDYVSAKTRNLTGVAQATAIKAAKEEASYYSSVLEKVKTAADLIGDKRAVKFILTAKGIDPDTVTPDYLKKVFASDLSDPASFANTQKDSRFRDLLATFNFDKTGKIVPPGKSGVQNANVIATMNTNYLQQTLETNAGNDNPGVRLALYFKRMSPNINTAYDILADPALSEVFRTTFGMPAGMANMEISKQATIVENKLNMADLKKSDFLDKFIARFTAMYDLANGDSGGTNSALSILTGR